MDAITFSKKIRVSFPVGAIFQNPGGGTSTIVSLLGDRLAYRRGKSTMRILYSDLYEAYLLSKGARLDSRLLRQFKPWIFDSAARPAGHSCHCTMLMMLLHGMGLSGPILGSGRVGNPFYVDVLPFST